MFQACGGEFHVCYKYFCITSAWHFNRKLSWRRSFFSSGMAQAPPWTAKTNGRAPQKTSNFPLIWVSIWKFQEKNLMKYFKKHGNMKVVVVFHSGFHGLSLLYSRLCRWLFLCKSERPWKKTQQKQQARLTTEKTKQDLLFWWPPTKSIVPELKPRQWIVALSGKRRSALDDIPMQSIRWSEHSLSDFHTFDNSLTSFCFTNNFHFLEIYYC